MSKKKYPPNTVGSRIITAFPIVKVGEKIKDVEKTLLDRADTFDTIDYVYVVDNNGLLNGAISIRELHASDKDANVEDIMKKKLIVAHPLTHKERVVYLALSNKIKAIPLLTKKNIFLELSPMMLFCKYSMRKSVKMFSNLAVYFTRLERNIPQSNLLRLQ